MPVQGLHFWEAWQLALCREMRPDMMLTRAEQHRPRAPACAGKRRAMLSAGRAAWLPGWCIDCFARCMPPHPLLRLQVHHARTFDILVERFNMSDVKLAHDVR